MENIRTRFITPSQFPLVVEPLDRHLSLQEALATLEKNYPYLRAKLLQYGALLFRDFPIDNAHAFVSVLKRLKMGDFCNYIGGDSPRNKVVEGVYTSTEAPPSVKLPLHNELSYVQSFPSHIHFYCEVAPKVQGETLLGDARKIYQAIDKDVLERFEKRGLNYISCYPYKSRLMNFLNKSHKSWVNVFETEDKAEVEKKCKEHDIDFEWNKNDWIKISQLRPATLVHPHTQEKVWFNQAHHYDLNPKFLGWRLYLGAKLLYCRKHTLLHEIYFGNRTKIPREDLYHIMDVLDNQTVHFPWKKGDVLVLDNILAMHGRAAFKGPRRILTAMTN